MRIFAKNDILAKSKFWYFLKRQKKVKKANGEILSVSEIFERNTNAVRNYGLVVRYARLQRKCQSAQQCIDQELESTTCTKNTETSAFVELFLKCTWKCPEDTEPSTTPSTSSRPQQLKIQSSEDNTPSLCQQCRQNSQKSHRQFVLHQRDKDQHSYHTDQIPPSYKIWVFKRSLHL